MRGSGHKISNQVGGGTSLTLRVGAELHGSGKEAGSVRYAVTVDEK